jgi:hypothetical protein
LEVSSIPSSTIKERELKITDMRKVELGKLFDEVFYRIFEIHDENEKLARSMRDTLKQHQLGDFSKTWGWNSENLKHLTPYEFLLRIESAFAPPQMQNRAQLAQFRANETRRLNWANLVKKAGATLSDNRSKQSDQYNAAKDAILDDLETLIKERGRELAEGLKNRRNSLVQGWQDELRHLAGLSSLETEMKSSLGTVTKSSPETEMKIEDSRFRGKGKAVRMPQNV